MKKPPYRQVFTLQTPLENVECWNKTGPERYTLPIGTLLLIEHAYDSTRTTCMAQRCKANATTYQDTTKKGRTTV